MNKRPRFRVLTLMLLVAACALGLAGWRWYDWESRRAERRAIAVALEFLGRLPAGPLPWTDLRAVPQGPNRTNTYQRFMVVGRDPSTGEEVRVPTLVPADPPSEAR
jgi:hypothetical protein